VDQSVRFIMEAPLLHVKDLSSFHPSRTSSKVPILYLKDSYSCPPSHVSPIPASTVPDFRPWSGGRPSSVLRSWARDLMVSISKQQLLVRSVPPERSRELSQNELYWEGDKRSLESGLARTVAKDFLHLVIETQCYRISISSITFLNEVLQCCPERSFDPLHPGHAVTCKQ
jgi:hypothetical protein